MANHGFLQTLRTVLFLLVVGLSALPRTGGADEPDLTTIRVIFGPEAEDITGQVDWYNSEIGIVEKESISELDGDVVGFDFSREFDRYKESNQFAFANLAGDIGIGLLMPGRRIYHRVTVDPGTTEIVVDLSDMARFYVKAEALMDNDFVVLRADGARDFVGAAEYWKHVRKRIIMPDLQKTVRAYYYLRPGKYDVTLSAPDRDLSETQKVRLEAGETTALRFTLGN